MFNLVENMKIVECIAPATDAAGRTGAYVSLKNVKRAYIVANVTQGNAATIALSVLQATAVAGTGSKAIANAVPIFVNADVATNDTLVRQADAVAFTTDTGVKNKIIVFQVDPSLLDTNNNFDCIGLSTGASNVANITSAVFMLDMKYSQATPPSAVTD